MLSLRGHRVTQYSLRVFEAVITKKSEVYLSGKVSSRGRIS